MELNDDENFIQNKYGYCFYWIGATPVIYGLYVHHQYRRQGHSKTLLQYVVGEIRRTGYLGDILIEAKPLENSINLNDLVKYYEKFRLKCTNTERG